MSAAVHELIEEHDVQFVDLRFTDLRGKEQHVTVPKDKVDEGFFRQGKVFDGSSIAGWAMINKSDLVLLPDPSTAVLDPFCDVPTLNLRCDIFDPVAKSPYIRDPRGVARRAEAY